MNPEFRQNESYESEVEKVYEAWLARVRSCYGEDFGYNTEKESLAYDLFASGASPLAATHELEWAFGEQA